MVFFISAVIFIEFLLYPVMGVIGGGIFAAVAHWWPFGNAVDGQTVIAIGIIAGLFTWMMCKLHHYPI